MAREIKFKGIKIEDVKNLSLEEFSRLIPSNQRRTLKRGLSDRQKKLLEQIKKYPDKFHKTHERDLIIIPDMVDKKIGVHNGKEFVSIFVKEEMIGHRLGEFALTRKRIAHSSPGVGATRGSKHIPLK